MNIKRQLLAYTAAIVFICSTLSAAAAFYVKNINTLIKDENHIYLNEVANQSSEAIFNKFNGDIRMLRSIASMLGNQEKIDTDYWIESFKKNDLFKDFYNIDIKLTSVDGYGQDRNGTNYADLEYFQKALLGKYNISNPITDISTGELSNVYAVPIYNQDIIIGVLIAETHNDIYKKILYTSVFTGMGYTYIVESNGTPVVLSNHPDSSPDFKNIFDTVIATDKQIEVMKQNMLQGNSGKLDYMSRDKERYLNYVPLGINDWFVISVVPYDAVKQKEQHIMNITIVSTIIVILSFSALIIYIFISQSKNQQKLSNMAFFDELTKMPNKYKFILTATDLLSNTKVKYAYVIADINKFKIINDFFGYEQGDILLIHMSIIISSSLKRNETCARVSADTFHILMEYTDKTVLEERLNALSISICSYKFGSDTAYRISIGFGVYVIDTKDSSIEAMGDKADLALNSIKNHHTTSCYFYNDDIRNKLIDEKEIENDMQKAIDNNDFQIFLQPKYSLSDYTIKGSEALVRWLHPTKGLIYPDRFIPIFEKNGFITVFDIYMLECVCKQLREWINKGLKPVTVSVNQSRIHLHNPDYVKSLMTVIKKYEIIPSLIEIEITESAFFEDSEAMIKIVTELHYLGFKISMDDFGSGYSSLNMLQDIFVDIIKIDKNFFNNSSNSNRGRKIVSNIISMANDINIQVIAEGVETKEQVDFLKSTGCNLVQGYYFSKAVTIAEFEKINLYACEK